MMNCDKAKSLLSDYIDGTLESEVKAEIDIYLEKDPECKTVFKEVSDIQGKLAKLPQVSPSADFDSNLRNRIINIDSTDKSPALNKKGLSLVFSGTVLVAALYLFIFTDIGMQYNTQEGPMPSSAIGGPSTHVDKNVVASDNIVEPAIEQPESDSLKSIPEKVNTSNIHLTGEESK
jgi:predicted anti-sigma-YlaC factor YlaD